MKTTASIGQWLFDVLRQVSTDNTETVLLKQLEATFPTDAHLSFTEFLSSPSWFELREKGMLLL